MPMKHAQSKNAKKKILYLHNVVLKHVLVREWWSQNSPILYKSMNGCGPTGEEQRCGCRNVPKHNLNSSNRKLGANKQQISPPLPTVTLIQPSV